MHKLHQLHDIKRLESFENSQNFYQKEYSVQRFLRGVNEESYREKRHSFLEKICLSILLCNFQMVSDRKNLSLRYVLSIELDDHYDQENALNYYYVMEIILMFNPEKGEPSVELYRSQAHNNVYDLTDGDDGAVMLENDEIHLYFTFFIFFFVVVIVAI